MVDYPDGTIPISTITADNLIIDKLTVGAITERRETLSNNGSTPLWIANNKTNYRGKFFPRGCRGFIKRVEVYCRNTSASLEGLTIYIGHRMGMGYVYGVILGISVPAGAAAAWRGIDFNVPFNYDSLFIMVSAYIANALEIGYDADEKPDAYDSTDTYSWVSTDKRYWIRIIFEGLTVGDVPVSGTINAINLPSVVGDLKESTVSNKDGGTSINIIDINGSSGKLLGLILHIKQSAGTVTAADMELTWNIDGSTYTDIISEYILPFAGVTNVHAPLNFFKIDDTNHDYAFSINVPIPFQQKLVLTVKNKAAAGNKIDIARWYIYETLK